MAELNEGDAEGVLPLDEANVVRESFLEEHQVHELSILSCPLFAMRQAGTATRAHDCRT